MCFLNFMYTSKVLDSGCSQSARRYLISLKVLALTERQKQHETIFVFPMLCMLGNFACLFFVGCYFFFKINI